jgi:hypothetical protein
MCGGPEERLGFPGILVLIREAREAHLIIYSITYLRKRKTAIRNKTY